MGRGRAKAKQTKVARELKYSSPPANFDALQRELSGGSDAVRSNDERVVDDDDGDDDDFRR
jgi:hypothetical protein